MNVSADDSILLLKAATVDMAVVAKTIGVSTLTLEEVWEDLKKVASSVAKMYTDESCFALSYNDLNAECMRKVVHALDKGYFKKPRTEFFKLVKTAMNNHVRGIVQRHRYTIKRTGHKPPERGDMTAVNFKPEVSMDDPENGIQVADMEDTAGIGHFDAELVEDVKVYLTTIEKVVLDQLINPNDAAFMHAYLEASIGRRRRDTLNVKLGQVSMAYGLGMALDEFCKVQDSIKRKYMTNVITDKPEDLRFNAALATLENIYGVQIPRSTEKVVIARLFTIAARDQLDKATPDIDRLLNAVGAKSPVIEEGRLHCFGVLFAKNHRICQACGLRQACQVDAANYGLGEITLSPKLLGSKNVRFATITDNSPQPMSTDTDAQTTETMVKHSVDTKETQREPFTNNERDEVLLNHLREHYKQIKFGTDIYFTLKDGKNACIFYIGKEGERFDLRFCKPSDDLKKTLVRKVRSFYLPDDASSDDALAMIEKHGSHTFKKE
jgi:hypothetical protein